MRGTSLNFTNLKTRGMELEVGFEPTRSRTLAYKASAIGHYATPAYINKAVP